jgi:hypothetical protein
MESVFILLRLHFNQCLLGGGEVVQITGTWQSGRGRGPHLSSVFFDTVNFTNRNFF